MNRFFFILMLSSVSSCLSADPINYAKIKGREAEFSEAIAKAESACGINKTDDIKSKQSSILAYWIGNDTNKLLLEVVLVGIKTNEAQPQTRLIVAWHNRLQYDSSWRAYTNDDVDYRAVVWRKNYLLSDHGFSRKEIEAFWRQSTGSNKADTTTILDWIFTDNLQSFSNDSK